MAYSASLRCLPLARPLPHRTMTDRELLVGGRVARGGEGRIGRRSEEEGEGTVTPFGAAGNCVNFNGDDAKTTTKLR